MLAATNRSVQLWYTSHKHNGLKSLWATYFSWLTPLELVRYQRFASEEQAQQYLIARAMLRSVLSQWMPEVAPQDWRFTVDDNGKPQLDDAFSHFDVHFNVSHSGDVVVLALCQGSPVGVDVEYVHRPVFSLAMAERYFSVSEIASLKILPEDKLITSVAELWTLKESYLKVSGLGLRAPLNHFSFTYDGSSSIMLTPPTDSLKNQYFTSLYELGCDYRIALAYPVATKLNRASAANPPELIEWLPTQQTLGYPSKLLRSNRTVFCESHEPNCC